MDPRNRDLQRFINLRMGAFHASCIFIAVIGKRFAAAGLKDLCIEAGLVGVSSVESMLKGKHYNRAVRCLKIAYEAFQRLKFEAFEKWLKNRHNSLAMVNFLESSELNRMINDLNGGTFNSALEMIATLYELFQKFEEECILSELGPMATYWNSFIEMVQILLNYIKSTRTGDWPAHLQASERMLKWYFAYDRTNYSRHFTYNWATLQNLKETPRNA